MLNYTYTIYNTINLETDKKIREHLKLLEKIISPAMNDAGFQFNPEKEGGLGLDYISQDSDYMGNIGFGFDDISGKQTFTIYILKSYDKNDCRYWLRKYMLEHADLYVIEPQLKELFQKALDIYNGWTKKDLVNVIELSR